MAWIDNAPELTAAVKASYTSKNPVRISSVERINNVLEEGTLKVRSKTVTDVWEIRGLTESAAMAAKARYATDSSGGIIIHTYDEILTGQGTTSQLIESWSRWVPNCRGTTVDAQARRVNEARGWTVTVTESVTTIESVKINGTVIAESSARQKGTWWYQTA